MTVKKLKRKASEGDGSIPVSKDINSSVSEPPKKKHRGLSSEEFIAALKGPDGSQAVREWLYTISSVKEKKEMDRFLLSQDKKAKAEATKLQSTDDHENEEECNEVESKAKSKRSQMKDKNIVKGKGEEEGEDEEDGEDEKKGEESEEDNEKDKESSEGEEEEEDDEKRGLVLNVCADRIDNFLASGGSVKDIIGTLPSPAMVEKVSQIKWIFRTIFKVLVRIAANHQDKKPEALEACQQLLSSYTKCINDMLKSQREPFLFLDILTAMVTLDPKLGKQILDTIILKAEIVENFTSLKAILKCRTAYIKFIIALLIDVDNTLVRGVCFQPWMLSCIMEGLQYDPPDIVVLYLMTIKKAIVENPATTKTSKLSIFNSDAIISLLYLYKWKGPLNRPKTKSLAFWAMKKITETPKIQIEVDSEDIDRVSSAAHELLLILLTSQRYGIIFRDLQKTERNNTLVANVLTRVGHPWGNPKVADLISKTLAACPDALQTTMESLEPLIQPRSSPQWFNCAKFLCQVLEDQQPETLQQQLPMKMLQLANASINMCIPMSVVRALNVNEAKAFCNEDIAVAKSSLELFLCMLRKALSFKNLVSRWASQKIISYAQSTTFHTNFTKSVLQNVPSLNSIQKACQVWSNKLSECESVAADDETPTRPIDILSLLLSVLELYFGLFPQILHPLRAAQSDFKTFMTTLVLQDTDSEDLALLRIRFFQLRLAIKDESFALGNDDLRNPISIVFQDLTRPNETLRDLASALLQTLIKRSESLEGTSQEAIIWLSNFQETFSGKKECSVAVNMLVESMIRACVLSPKYLDIIASAEDEAGKLIDEHCSTALVLSDGRTLQKLFDDLSENKDVQQPCDDFYFSAKLSPWLPAFLEVLREHINEKKLRRREREVVEVFCCKVILRLLCRFPHSGAFLHLALHAYPDVIPSKLSLYLQSWLPGGSPQPVELNLLGENSAEVKLGTFLFCEKEDTSLQDTIKKLFVSLFLPTIDNNSLENLSEANRLKATSDIVQIVHFICFHLTQLAQLEKLTEGCVRKSQEMLLFIFDTASHFDQFGEKGLLSDCFKVILFHPFLYQHFNPLAKHRSNFSTLLTNLMIKILKEASKCPELQEYIVPYKRKMLESLKLVIQKKKRAPKERITDMLESFKLTFQEISSILVLISDLPSSSLINNSQGYPELSEWVDLSEHLLIRASELRNKGSSDNNDIMILPSSVILQMSNWVVDFLSYKNIYVTSILEAFMLYIKSCPQQTTSMSDRLLSCLLTTTQYSPAVNNLIEWMASCMPLKDLKATLIDFVEKNQRFDVNVHVIFPLIRVVLKEDVKIPVLGSLYSFLRVKIDDYLLNLNNHPEWLALNADVVVFLMKRYMKQDAREKVCKALKTKVPVLTKEKLYYIQLITEAVRIHQPQVLLLLLAWLGNALKKYQNASDKGIVAKPLCEALEKILQEETQEEFTSVIESNVWQETLRSVLKYALVAKDEEQSDLACVLLQTLAIVFKKMYSTQEGHDHVPMVHSLITQHSEFNNLMLSHNPCKFELIKMLHVLLELNPKIMESSHAPVLLSAYNASLSKTDRALLKILIMYEKCGIDFSPYRPFFWGRQGADYYAIWSQAKNNRSLDKQLKPDEVLNLLKENIVMNTIAHFPLHSTFKITDAETENVGTVQVYDPSFYLPLFIYLLSPESLLIAHQFMRSGALAITLTALSSYDEAVRAAAYTVLSRYLSHLEMARGLNKEIATNFVSAIQKGVLELNCENTQLSSVATVFLARASLVIIDPREALNKTLLNFVLAKPALNLRTVPEFFELMHSGHVDHLAHRHWILEVLKDGIKERSDIDLCMKSIVFKLILSFYSSCLSDSQSKLNILNCIQSVVSIQYGACCLVRDYSLTSWLHQTILSTNIEDTALIGAMVRIVSKMWDSLSMPANPEETPIVINPESKVFHLLRALLPKLEATTSNETLSQFVDVLSNVVPHLSANDMSFFTKELLVSIFEIMSPRCPNKRQFFDLLELGCKFIGINNTKISYPALDNSLRILTIQWLKHRTSK